MWEDALARPAAQASAAVAAFAHILTNLPSREPACGRDYLALLMREVHGLPWSPEEAIVLARGAFDALGERIAHHPARGAAPLPMIRPADLPAACRHWHDRALAAATSLVTPAADYGLSFKHLPEWARGTSETCTSCPTAARQPSHRVPTASTGLLPRDSLR